MQVCRLELKKFSFAFFFLFAIFFASKNAALQAQTIDLQLPSPLFGSNDLYTGKTVWFDIIYPPQSAQTAKILIEKADALYEKACAIFDTTPTFRMPLVIMPNHDVLNAYFSSVPYNRIVLYDTIPDYSLAVFTDDLLSVIYHEIVHAVTFNLKTPFTKALGEIFGDALSPLTILYANSGISEGVAVALESESGKGRVNDPFTMHVLKQAKVDGKFPGRLEITGARDIYPNGNEAYTFGGAYMAFLKKTYGDEAFSLLWHELNKMQFIRETDGIFKKVYNKKNRDLWKEFEASIKIPETFDKPQSVPPLQLQKGSAIYSVIASSDAGIAWLDSISGKIYFLPSTGKNGKKPKAKKVLTVEFASHISLSKDGRFLAVTKENYIGNMTTTVFVYDLQKKLPPKRIPVPHLRQGTLITGSDGKRYLAAVKRSGSSASLIFYALEENGGVRNAKTESAAHFSFAEVALTFTPVDAGNGSAAFLIKERDTWTINLLDFLSGKMVSYELPKEIVAIQNLNIRSKENENTIDIYFSWANENTFPRLGKLSIEKNNTANASFELSQEDYSGGVYSPVPFDGFDGYNTVYIEKHFASSAIACANFTSSNNRTQKAITKNTIVPQKTEKAIAAANTETKNVNRYNPFKYFTKGIFVPLPIIFFYDESMLSLDLLLGPGITYGTTDPAEKIGWIFSGGYDPFIYTYAFFFEIFGGNLNFNHVTAAQVNASTSEGGGFESVTLTNTLSSYIPLGLISKLYLANTFYFYQGKDDFWFTVYQRQYDWAKEYLLVDGRNGITSKSIYNTAYGGITTLRTSGTGFFEQSDAGIFAFLQTHYYDKDIDKAPNGYVVNNLGIETFVTVPRLLPFYNPPNFTLNLPTELDVQFFANYTNFMYIYAKTVLFSYEIQRGLPYTGLYFNRFSLTASYERDYFLPYPMGGDSWQIKQTPQILKDFNKLKYIDIITFSGVLTLSPNTGALLGYPVDVAFNFQLDPKSKFYLMSLSVKTSVFQFSKEISSISKTKNALGGITPPAPRSP